MYHGPISRRNQRRLRIVHCVRAPIGGIFRNVVDLAMTQAASGHHVGLVVDSLTGGEFEAAKIAELSPHLELGVTRLPMPRMVNPLDVFTGWRVYRSVAQLEPDVIHGHGAKGGSFARLVGTALSRPGRPVARFYSPHGGTLHYARRSLGGRAIFGIERFLEHFCDGIVHVSRYEANTYLDKVGAPRCGASVIVNGVRPGEFEPLEPDADAADLLYMGMMRDLKGVDVLIRAIDLIGRRLGRAVTANLLGEGPDLPAYRKLVADLGLADQIRFHGSQPTRRGLAMGRTMVVPSRAESMPYIVLEAIAAAVPVVATRVGGIPEIYGPVSWALVEPGNVEAMAEHIVEALDEREATVQRARLMRASLRERFTVERMAADVETLYFRALARRRDRREVGAEGNLQAAK